MIRKKRYKAKLDPQRDLVGATPEALVRALFKRTSPLPSGTGVKAVVRDEPLVRKPVSDQSQDDDPHLVDGVGTA